LPVCERLKKVPEDADKKIAASRSERGEQAAVDVEDLAVDEI
jgi:hypothetical protein